MQPLHAGCGLWRVPGAVQGICLSGSRCVLLTHLFLCAGDDGRSFASVSSPCQGASLLPFVGAGVGHKVSTLCYFPDPVHALRPAVVVTVPCVTLRAWHSCVTLCRSVSVGAQAVSCAHVHYLYQWSAS
jgi:hypothetical protein